MIMQALWFGLGIVTAALFLWYARGHTAQDEKSILGAGLVIAALVYVGFAALWGNPTWLAIELMGVLMYGLFYFLAQRGSAYWLAAGWAAHPLWDVLLHLVGKGHTIAPEWYVIACISFDLLVAAYIVSQVGIWSESNTTTQPLQNKI